MLELLVRALYRIGQILHSIIRSQDKGGSFIHVLPVHPVKDECQLRARGGGRSQDSTYLDLERYLPFSDEGAMMLTIRHSDARHLCT